MGASEQKSAISWGVRLGYGLLALVTVLLLYSVAAVWAGNLALVLFVLGATWLVDPRVRHLARAAAILFSTVLLLATAFVVLLGAAGALGADAASGLLVLLSLAAALVADVVLLAACFFLAVDLSVDWILAMREVYGVTRKEARRLLTSMFFRTSYPYYMVEDGAITQSKPSGLLPKLGGPGNVVIKPYNAVVFERSGSVTRIEGPGMIMTKRFEFPKSIVDLRKQWISFEAENVLTRDHVPLTIEAGVGFRIESRDTTARRNDRSEELYEGQRFHGVIGGDYPVYKSTIYKAVYNTTAVGWKATSQANAEGQLRSVLRQYSLADLYCFEGVEPDVRDSVIDQIAEEVHRRVSGSSHNWGTTITAFTIKRFEAPESVENGMRELWAKRYASATQVLGARGEQEAALIQAETQRQALEAVAHGKARATLIEGEAAAQARVALYQHVLSLEPSADKDTVWHILNNLHTMEEMRLMTRLFLQSGRRGLGRSEPMLSLPEDEDSEND